MTAAAVVVVGLAVLVIGAVMWAVAHDRTVAPAVPPSRMDPEPVAEIEESWRASGWQLRRDWGAEIRSAHREQQRLYAPLRAAIDDVDSEVDA